MTPGWHGQPEGNKRLDLRMYCPPGGAQYAHNTRMLADPGFAQQAGRIGAYPQKKSSKPVCFGFPTIESKSSPMEDVI